MRQSYKGQHHICGHNYLNQVMSVLQGKYPNCSKFPFRAELEEGQGMSSLVPMRLWFFFFVLSAKPGTAKMYQQPTHTLNMFFPESPYMGALVEVFGPQIIVYLWRWRWLQTPLSCLLRSSKPLAPPHAQEETDQLPHKQPKSLISNLGFNTHTLRNSGEWA